MAQDILTQGTHLYVVDTSDSTPKIAKVDCIASISGIGGGSKNKIKTTRLSDKGSNRYVSGLSDPSAISVPYMFDTTANNHRLFEKLKGQTVKWLICLSDGDDEPELTDGKMVAPVDRTGIIFEGYVDENTIDFAEDDIVKGTLTIQVSGNTEFTYKA